MNETLDTDVPAGGPRGLNTLFGRWKNQAVMISPNPLIQRHHPHHSHAEIIPPSYGICAGHKFPFVLGNILYIFPCVCHQEIKLKKKKKRERLNELPHYTRLRGLIVAFMLCQTSVSGVKA